MTYTPETLDKWTLPDSYWGKHWDEYYVFLGQHRDSDALTRSNFICGLKEIGGESETVTVVQESHWAVGWVEWIAIHESDNKALEIADNIAYELTQYPVVNEEHWGEMELEEAKEVWAQCYDNKDRLEYIRKHRDQFWWNSFSDLRAQVRGEYFSGYASELLC